MNRITLSACGAVLSLSLALHDVPAQSSTAIQQLDSVQQRRALESAAGQAETGQTAPALYPEETSDVGPQSVIQYQRRRTHFEAMGDVQYFYTDNMFLADKGREDADVLVSTAQFALAPEPYELGGGKFAPRLGYRHQWFNFGLWSDKSVTVFDFDTLLFRQAKLNEFDFNAQTLFTDMRWNCGPWTAGLGFDFTRLLDSEDYNQFYRESVPRWSLHRLFPTSPQSAVMIGYEGAYRFTDADLPPPGAGDDFNDRTDHSLVFSYTHAICPQAMLQPYYRFKYTHFTRGQDRDDFLNSVGIALYCRFTPQISLRAFVGYELLETSRSAFAQDYRRLDAGGGLNLAIRF